MNVKQIRGSIILLITAVIWGVAFVAQSVGMDYVGPFTFTCSRSIVGGIALMPCIWLLEKMGLGDAYKGERSEEEKKKEKKLLVLGGITCGIILCAATCFQQIGIMYTSVGKAGFITAFYIVMVPVIGLFFKKKCGPLIWLGVVLALGGLYFLCINESFSIQPGDILEFICAILFSVHILCVDYFTGKVSGVKMSCIQFWVGGILSGILMLIFEQPHFTQILAAWKPVLYAGILSSGVGYTFQIIGQRDVNPTVASLIMSLESVISVLAAMLILGQKLTGRELTGCVLMFGAIVLAQIPQKEIK